MARLPHHVAMEQKYQGSTVLGEVLAEAYKVYPTKITKKIKSLPNKMLGRRYLTNKNIEVFFFLDILNAEFFLCV